MPPLLPEYLNQPFQVAVRSLPPTEWWPVWVAAGATLLGSFGGAWIGGRVAYRSTVKANNALLERQKLEEALALILDIEKPAQELVHFFSSPATLAADSDAKNRANEKVEKIDRENISRLIALIEIYGHWPELEIAVRALEIHILSLKAQILGMGARSAFASATEIQHIDIKNSAETCISKIDYIKKFLVKVLHLKR
ncbi:hypothetical protein LG331_08150 [Vreelandella aquamarina]|uniref:hypothetical protein n=1 Tax=Vreelandella aquamarina TaxID=77097 RepID=UPI003851734D